MVSLDQVAESLRSNKVRERTDALAQLEDVNWRSHSVQRGLDREICVKLVGALSQFIVFDALAYERTPANAQPEARLVKASHMLKLLVSTIVTQPRLVASFKQRHYDAVLDALTSNLISSTGDRVLEPVARNCTQGLYEVLRTQDFKDHLAVSKYEAIISKLLECLDILTNSARTCSPANDVLVGDLLTVFLEFLGPRCTSTLSVFSNSNTVSSIDNYYLRIINVIVNYSSNVFARRETRCVVVIFRILNRCLVDLATLDVKLCYRIYKIGSHLLTELKAITFPKLIDQTALFANLVPDFIYLPDFPRITGDNWNIDSSGRLANASSASNDDLHDRHNDSMFDESFESSGEVIASDSEGTQHSTAAATRNEAEAKQLIDLIGIILELVYKDTNLLLPASKINLHLFQPLEDDVSWFNLADFGLSDTDDAAGWTLRLGLARLITVYYRMNPSSATESTQPLQQHQAKRRRLTSSIELRNQFLANIRSCSTVHGFLLSLITINNDSMSLLSLQMLSLLYSYFASTMSKPSSSASSLDTLSDGIPHIFDSILIRLDSPQREVKYWGILSLFVLINDPVFENLSANHVNRLVKYSLEFIKTQDLCKVASALLCRVLRAITSTGRGSALNKTVLQQYETTIDLAEISGPAIICKESAALWGLSLDICRNYRLHSIHLRNISQTSDGQQLFASKVSNWFLSRVNQLGNLKSPGDISAVSVLVSWLMGAEDLKFRRESTDHLDLVYRGSYLDVFSLYIEESTLRDYILMDRQHDLEPSRHSEPPLKCHPLAVDETTSRSLLDSFTQFLEGVWYNRTAFNATYDWWLAVLAAFPKELRPDIVKHIPFISESSDHPREEYRALLSMVDAVNLISWDDLSLLSLVSAYGKPEQIADMLLGYLTDDQFESGNTVDRTHQEGPELDTQMIDLMLTDSTPSLIDSERSGTEIYNYLSLSQNPTAEMKLIKFCMIVLRRTLEPSKVIQKCIQIAVAQPSELKMLACYFEIVSCLPYFRLDTLTIKCVQDLLENSMDLLEQHTTKTYELTITVMCRLFSLTSSRWLSSADEQFKSDCLQVYDFFRLLLEKGMLYTEREAIEFCKFGAKILEAGEEKSGMEDAFVLHTISSDFSESNNFAKSSITPSIATLIKSRPHVQFDIYDEFVKSFNQPQKSVESSATFNYCLSVLSTSSDSLTLAAICHILESSQYSQIKAYLDYSLHDACRLNQIASPTEFFWSFKELIFKCWRGFELPMQQFPFKALGCSDCPELVHRYCKELTAIALAYNDKKAVTQIAQFAHRDDYSTVKDSAALAVALSWTKGAVEEKIYSLLDRFLQPSKTSAKNVIKQQLLLVIYQLLRFCDCSSGQNLFAALQKYYAITVKMTKVKDDLITDVLSEFDMTIAPGKCFGIVSKLIQNYGQKDFWSVPTLYFLSSHFLFGLDRSFLQSQKRTGLRRLKAIMMIDSRLFANINITQLVSREVSKHLGNDSLLDQDLESFLCTLLEVVVTYNPAAYCRVCTPVLRSLLQLDGKYTQLCHCMSTHLSLIKDRREGYYRLANAAVELLARGNVDLSTESAVSLLVTSDNSDGDAIHLLSIILPHTSSWRKNDTLISKSLVQRLYTIQEKHITVSDEFKGWIGYCIGRFYSNTGQCPEVHDNEFDEKLFDKYDGPGFATKVKQMDTIFEQMIDRLPGGDLGDRLCFNLIASAIIHKEQNSGGVKDILNYSVIFSSFEEYIPPMDTYVCSLADSDIQSNNYNVYYNESLDTTLKGFTVMVQQSSMDTWLRKVYFSIVNELNSRMSLVTILAAYIYRVPSFSRESFAPLVLFYINEETAHKGRLVAKMINDLFSIDFANVPVGAIELFIELTLLIRVGAKNNIRNFFNITSLLDMHRIYEAALYVKKPKAAVMLMEDYYLLPMNGEEVGHWRTQEYMFLQKAYSLLDDNDLFFGLPADATLDCGVNLIQHNVKKTGSMMFDNAELEVALSSDNQQRIMTSSKSLSQDMLDLGWSGISSVVGQDLNVPRDHMDLIYERSWKLNQWDLPAPELPVTEQQAIYLSLKSVKDDPEHRSSICDSLIDNLSGRLSSFCSLDSWCKSLAFILNVRDVLSLESSNTLKYVNRSEEFLKWIDTCEPSASENIILGRKCAYELLSQMVKFNNSEVIQGFGVLNELHRYGELMRLKGESQKSINSAVYSNRFIQRFQKERPSVQKGMHRIAAFDMAAAFWSQGEETTFPVVTLKKIILEKPGRPPVKAPKLTTGILYAYVSKWAMASRQETPDDIMKEYIDKEAQISANDIPENSLMFHMFAKFCDSQIRSGDLDSKIDKLHESVRKLGHDLRELDRLYRKTDASEKERKEARRAHNRLKVQYKSQMAELQTAKSGKENYIARAIEFYLKAIILDTENDHRTDIDRFCALWLENSDLKLNGKYVEKIPSWMFVEWLNQLSSRMLDEETPFQRLLGALLHRVALHHPFHALYLLESLCITMKESSDAAAQSRGRAAKALWNQLNKSHSDFRVIGMKNVLESVSTLCARSIDLVGFKMKSRTKKSRLSSMPEGHWWLEQLPKMGLPSPVAHIPVITHGSYDMAKLPTIVGVDPYVTPTASGISQPKVLKLLLSNGDTQKILMKGGSDDLRQDAIMEQVFEKVNTLLRLDDQTRRRSLRIRTYKVVSLGPRSGIIEFVTNSTALIEILKPLHRGDDLRIDQARAKMREVESEGKKVRCDTYDEICRQIRPEFRRFFFNNFLSSDSWYQSRLMYSRGVAATSIVGYVLGLGDRHCNNILIDRSSGEPIHIDLGVAFDAGKALTIPETVPFRLTRDMVDGLGITGTDGLFSKSCEQVLRVLRSHSEYICGILDVLRYDPLYSWTLSPLRKKQLQNFNAEEEPLDRLLQQDSGSEASIAINTVKQKLEASGLGDEAVVRVLIRDATDASNLAQIFMGWSPFL